jgi:hypothetical protein
MAECLITWMACIDWMNTEQVKDQLLDHDMLQKPPAGTA